MSPLSRIGCEHYEPAKKQSLPGSVCARWFDFQMLIELRRPHTRVMSASISLLFGYVIKSDEAERGHAKGK